MIARPIAVSVDTVAQAAQYVLLIAPCLFSNIAVAGWHFEFPAWRTRWLGEPWERDIVAGSAVPTADPQRAPVEAAVPAAIGAGRRHHGATPGVYGACGWADFTGRPGQISVIPARGSPAAGRCPIARLPFNMNPESEPGAVGPGTTMITKNRLVAALCCPAPAGGGAPRE